MWHFSCNTRTAYELLSLELFHYLLHSTLTNCVRRAAAHALPAIAKWGNWQAITRANLDHVAIGVVKKNLLNFDHVLDNRTPHIVDPMRGEAGLYFLQTVTSERNVISLGVDWRWVWRTLVADLQEVYANPIVEEP